MLFKNNNIEVAEELAQLPVSRAIDKPEKFAISFGRNKVHVYMRENSPFYQCGFHYKGKYPRTSTMEKSPTQARVFAEKWFWQKRLEIEAGTLKVGGIKFGKAAEHALEAYRKKVAKGEKSKHYLRGLEMCLTARVLPFFKDIPIDQIDTTTWSEYKEHIDKTYPTSTARATLHQHKNAVRVVLNEAHKKGWLEQVPSFKDDYNSQGQSRPRAWFEPAEYKRLYLASRANIKRLSTTRHAEAAKELHDYMIFVANTGLRIGEANNVRFCDVEVTPVIDGGTDRERHTLLIKNIKGKRGTGECRSHFGAVEAYRRIVARRKPEPGAREKLFVSHHRDMFKALLERINLRTSAGQPPVHRDFVSLRHTYICFRLMKGASVFDVAVNCRTSVTVIQKHYAQFLSARMTTSINRELNGAGFGAEGKNGA